MFNSSFVSAFANTNTTIDFNSAWENGTGYYDHAMRGKHAPVLVPGEMVKTVSPSGRRILIIGTRFGNAVIFDRYTDTNSKVVVGNIPSQIEELFLGSAIGGNIAQDDVTLVMLLGDPKFAASIPNIGQRIENMFASWDKKAKIAMNNSNLELAQ